MVTDLLGVKCVPVIMTVPPTNRTVFGLALRDAAEAEVGQGFDVGVGDGLGVGFGVVFGVGFGLGLDVEPDVGFGLGDDPGRGVRPGVGVVPGLPEAVGDGDALDDGVGLAGAPGATIRSCFCRGQEPAQHTFTVCMPVVTEGGMTIPCRKSP
jgi:hypothetical protein